jgi:hypothetical protein
MTRGRYTRPVTSGTRHLVLIAGALALLGSVAFALLDAFFPDGERAVGSAESQAAGRAELEQMMETYGTLAAVQQNGALLGLVEDEWSPLFASFSYWPEPSARVDFAAAPAPLGYRARFAFSSGERWGVDGEPWVVEHGLPVPDSPKRFRAGYAGVETPRLLFLPFSVALEGASVVLHRRGDVSSGRPHVLSVRFRKPNRGPSFTAEWRLYVDPGSHRLLEVVLEQTAISDAPILVRCRAEGLLEASGISLVERYRCAISNRLEVPLFERTLRSPSFKPVTPGMFAPQRREAPGGVQPG